jgi:hypothetical protein
MGHNVLSYGSPEAARRANRAINKVAQDGGFVGVKPTERRTHTAVAGQGGTTVEYNGYFKIVDITEYYDEDGKEIDNPKYKIRICDGMNPTDSIAGICQINMKQFQLEATELSWTDLNKDYITLHSKNENETSSSDFYFDFHAYTPQTGGETVTYLIGRLAISDKKLVIQQRHGTTGFSSNGVIMLLRFARFSCASKEE